jgi:hypothetical protein
MCQLQGLPPSLERLYLPAVHVCVLAEDDSDAEGADAAPALQQLDISHLTCLMQLQLKLYDSSTPLREMRINAQLPQQLLGLHASAEGCAVVPLLGITALQQLQKLALDDCCDSEEELDVLNGLTALTDIRLFYTGPYAAALTSSSWGRLSQLVEVHISGRYDDVLPDDGSRFRQVMQGLAAATSLRKLHFNFSESVTPEGLQPKLFGFLTGLRQLQELHASCRNVGVDAAAATEAYDAMQLTALTGLTKLEIIAWNVEDVGAVALACNLPELRVLQLYKCGVESKAALPAIGKLVHLQQLHLTMNEIDCDGCLQLLTQLRALTSLRLRDRNWDGPSDEELEVFWAAVGGQPEPQVLEQQ